MKYGYLVEKPEARNATTNKTEIDNTLYKRTEIEQALMDYQDFMSLPPTGIVDNKTVKKMNQKRCGMPDRFPRDKFHVKVSLTKSGRAKRDTNIFNKGGNGYSSSSLYGNKVYYWDIYPKPSFSSPLRRNIWHSLEYAFNRWASVTAVDFIRGDYKKYNDIEVGFYSSKYKYIQNITIILQIFIYYQFL